MPDILVFGIVAHIVYAERPGRLWFHYLCGERLFPADNRDNVTNDRLDSDFGLLK